MGGAVASGDFVVTSTGVSVLPTSLAMYMGCRQT
jgi:hypothetical protein